MENHWLKLRESWERLIRVKDIFLDYLNYSLDPKKETFDVLQYSIIWKYNGIKYHLYEICLKINKTDYILPVKRHNCHNAKRCISKSTKRSFGMSVSLCARDETRVVAREIVSTSPWQCNCSQRPENPTVPVREEHRCTWIPSLFALSWFV